LCARAVAAASTAKIHAVCFAAPASGTGAGLAVPQALADGDLEFLESRWLKIEVRDLALHWFMTVENGKLVVSQHAEADVSFSGDANDLILIAARKQDPDTLFFQRRLQIEGDTELGLYVKKSDGRHRVGSHACAIAPGPAATG
jgi:predicted lipid carrier protein YhbT